MAAPTFATSQRRGPWSAVGAICLTGLVLGLVYNWFGLHSPRGWGLPWIAEDRVAQLEASVVVGEGSPDAQDPYFTDVTDPLAVASEAPRPQELPEIPAVGRPVQIELGALRRYVDAAAALVVDAREAQEYAEGHIPDAISLPYDEVVTDPARLESVDSGGRPVVVYCGGGACESSLSLAWELFHAGHERVAVYVGGYPEWVAAGYPTTGVEGGG